MNDHNLDKKVNLTLTGLIDGIYDTKPSIEEQLQEPDTKMSDDIDAIIDRIKNLSHDDFMRLKERLMALYEET